VGVRLVVAALLAASAVGCVIEGAHVDPVPTIQVNGRTYLGSVPNGYVIPRASLSEYGTATSIVDPGSVVGASVLALEGVPPSKVVFMESRIAGVLFLMYFATDLPLSSDPNALLLAVPELCAYFSGECAAPAT
jgi:hypothetical protein